MSTYQVRSLEEADLIIKQHERKTKTSYALLRSTKNFGCIDVPACSNEEYEVRFDTVGVPYCGVPFFVAGLKILQCQSFKEKGSRGPAKKKEIKIELTGSGASVIGGLAGDGLVAEPTKTTAQRAPKKSAGGRSMRVSCTATIIMKEVIYYPEFQVFEHSRNGRLGVARQLKEVLRSKSTMQKDRIIYVTVPANSDHFGHPIGTVVNMKIPSKRIYVKNDYYGPVESSSSPGSSPTRRLYFPIKEEKTDSVEKKRRVASPDAIVGLTGFSDTSTNQMLGQEPARGAMSASLKKEHEVPNKAREVREVLQSIMAFTYKNGSQEAFETLHSDLLRAKQRYLDILGRKTLQQDQPQQHTQFRPPQQQIVLVKQQIKGHQQQPQNILAPRPPSVPQRPLQAKQPVMRLDQDPSALSITINAVPTSLGSGTVSSLPTLQGPTLTALPSHSLSSLAALPTGSISTIPSFSTVVVPTGLQPSSVTLTIPAGSLTTLNAGNISTMQPVSISSLSSMHTSSLSSFPAVSLPTFPTRSLAPASVGSSIPVGSLSAIQAGALASIQTGVLPTIQAAPLPSIVAASISPLLSESIVSIPTSSESFNRDIMSTMTVTPIPSLTIGSMSSSMPQQLPLVAMSSSSAPNTIISPYTVSSTTQSAALSPYTVSSPAPISTILPYAVSSSTSSSILSPYVSQQNQSTALGGVASSVTSLPPGTIISSTSLTSPNSQPTASQGREGPSLQTPNGVSSASCHAGAGSLAVSWSEASPSSPASVAVTASVSSDDTVGQQRSAAVGSVMVHLHQEHHAALVTHQHQQQQTQQQPDQERPAKSPLHQVPPISAGPPISLDQRGSAKDTITTTVANEATTNQETSIIIEAMEAILNSHM